MGLRATTIWGTFFPIFCAAKLWCDAGSGGEIAATSWPQFRGPSGQGVIPLSDWPLLWDENHNIVWKTAIPGRGWSSPVLDDGHVWLTTAEPTQLTPEQLVEREKLSLKAQEEELQVAATVRLSVVAVNLESGKIARQIPLFEVQSRQLIHQLNSYASPTPILENGRCYCHFGAFGTACVDVASGATIWRQKLHIEHSVGPGSSPALYADRLIVPCDGADRQFVAAIDKRTGNILWQKDRPPLRIEDGEHRKAFSTPLIVEVNGKTQIVVPGAQWFIAYDPTTGDELWRIDHGSGFSNVPRPVFDGKRVYLCTGFSSPELWAVRCDGAGDVTATHVDWKYTRQVPTIASPTLVGGRLYMISEGGVATCVDADTGQRIWQKRIPGKYSASPLASPDRIAFCSHEGVTTIVRASDSYEVLATNSLAGQLMASPAIVDRDLLLRSDANLYRIGRAD